jgi:hypothetical protein
MNEFKDMHELKNHPTNHLQKPKTQSLFFFPDRKRKKKSSERENADELRECISLTKER